MDLDAGSLTRVRSFWHRWQLDAPSADFLSVVWVGSDRFVSASPSQRDRVQADDPASVDDLLGMFDDRVMVASGEARLAYTDRATFRPVSSERVITIGAGDDLLAQLRRGADPEEWEESMGGHDWDHCCGVVDGGSLSAVAAHQVWDATLAHVGVFTAAGERSRGLATEAASATIERALADDLVPQWRVRVGLDASWHVAEKLGFVAIGRQIFVRWHDAA